MKAQKFLLPIAYAALGGMIAVFSSNYIFTNPSVNNNVTSNTPVKVTRVFASDSTASDFTWAAEKSVDAVVHVTTEYTQTLDYSFGNPLFDFFFGPYDRMPRQKVQSSGSGVILTHDGFIVTNNHVIENADEITVILNDKRKFAAKVVGTDPSTDIALLKIEADDLPFIPFGNSDNIHIGEWVLAIGNPFNLTSTVTAGIVSAKARNINLLRKDFAIESFIQTDAAVNPGNSGGALINLKGELIGINTAIASKTGSFTGYAFAVPSNIVKKVVTDIIEFGEVQRAILGVRIQELTAEVAQENGIKEIKGVYVFDVEKGGAADAAGIKPGDVILSVNGVDVNSTAQLQEQISRYRPNQKVDIIVNRNNSKKHFEVTLRNLKGGTGIVKTDATIASLGAEFKEITDKQKKQLGINYGIQVVELKDGKLKDGGIKKGYIITRMNRTPIRSVDDLKRVLSISSGGVLIEGIYPNGVVAYYAIGVD
ncbi:Do family serine endopeptidase [Tenuifilum thalassicum]|uniref:Do family serine endopeptidase n=1 Tax=Tenuifilum thalassicum TaxID=2590900 RepID=A0A7D3XDB0_9BACT|nr:Do family serine endopeptidase [Tenuifilum thalassicum]QKG79572.1 Do family serine endopeptidase [Tenuifilum thalassicum]